MSYLRKFEYKIIPEESLQISKNCPGCGCKTLFRNTGCFRVNANGNKIDVWLIYQCSQCKHTKNLTVYERCKPDFLTKEAYKAFFDNSSETALSYGTDISFFSRNKAEIDWSVLKYRIQSDHDLSHVGDSGFQKGDLIIIRNELALKIRMEKILSQILGLTRADLQKRQNTGEIEMEKNKLEHSIHVWFRK